MRLGIIVAIVGLSRLASADVSEPTNEGVVGEPVSQPRLGVLPPSLTDPIQPTVEVTSSYRSITMTVDALSIAALLGGFASEGKDGRDTDLTGPLYTAGALGGLFVTPIIHGIRGHGLRAVGSFLLRDGAMGVGAMIAVETATCGPQEWFCGLDRIGPGMLAGLVAASALDAAFLTDETEQRPVGVAWTPILAPARGGGTLGVAATF
jgi:hypothetical protein